MSHEKDEDIFHKEYFMCFSKDMNQDIAKERFKKKYGYEPDMCVINTGLLWVGPIWNFRKGESNG